MKIKKGGKCNVINREKGNIKVGSRILSEQSKAWRLVFLLKYEARMIRSFKFPFYSWHKYCVENNWLIVYYDKYYIIYLIIITDN